MARKKRYAVSGAIHKKMSFEEADAFARESCQHFGKFGWSSGKLWIVYELQKSSAAVPVAIWERSA